MSKRVLIVAAHPDDEVLGAGGAIARHVYYGDIVHVLILAEGITSRDVLRSRDNRAHELHTLAEMAKDAHAVLGTHDLILGSLPDNRMDSLDLLDVIKLIEDKVSSFSPNIIYTHHAGDVNIDHRVVHQAVTAACRPQVNRNFLENLFLFEVPSSTEWQLPGMFPAFTPNVFININDFLKKKIQSLNCYSSEMRQFPHPRSLEMIEHLSRWRGAMSGFQAAESFVAGRIRLF